MSILGSIGTGATVAITIKAIDQFSKTFKGANTALGKIAKVGGTAVAAVATGAVLLGGAAVKTAGSFETAFAGVRKTTNLTEEEFRQLEESFKDMSVTTGKSFEDLSAIGEIAGQLGVEGVGNLEKFTKTIADISVTTNLTAEEAATSFARISNIMGEPTSNVDKMASTVVDLGNNFATTESEIVNFANRIAGAGKIAGLTTDDTFAIGTAFSSVGVQAEAGGTAVQKVLIGMNTAVTEGGDKLGVFAETAGMSTEEFSRAWRDDAGAAFGAFVTGLGNQGDQAIITLDDLDLKDQRLIRSFLSVANAGDLITDALKASDDAWKDNTALTEEAEKRYDTFAQQMLGLKNGMRNFIEPLGKELIPLLLDLVKVFNDEVMPVIEPLIPLIGDVLTGAIKKLAPYLPELAEMFVQLVEAVFELFDAVEPLLDPLFEIAEAIFPSLMTIIKTLIPIIKIFSDALTPLLEILAPIVEFIAKLIDGIVQIQSALWQGTIGKVLTSFSDLFGGDSSSTSSSVSGRKLNGVSVDDAIISPSGEIITTNPNDYLIATQDPGSLGGTGITIYIDKVQGVDADEISDMLARRLALEIRR